MAGSRLIELLTKKKSGALSLPELKELKDLLARNPEDEFLASLVDDVFRQRLEYENMYSASKIEESLQRLHKKLEQQEGAGEKRSRVFRLNKMAAIAACLLLLAGLGLYMLYATGSQSLKQNVVATKKGSKSYILLPDGTQVWLNADSRVAYKDDFGKVNREITLTGEAYFNVVKDKSRPFIIHTETIDVKVLGTVFNVRAYKNDRSTETTLIRGSVEVSMRKDPDRKFLLKPFEKFSVSNSEEVRDKEEAGSESTALYTVNKIKPVADSSGSMETEWVKNRLVFEKERLDAIAMEISRWFDVEILITDEHLKSMEYSGAVGNASLEQVLESLKLTGALNYKINNKTVTITP
ncbi:FecR family protein [Chitinophagaceae bacterium LB-8]|uniref:FecR family protein n=1 Tax=Paraflavisolibacter caeni TaxID=2982496 RepID=A0A9X2XVT6_9BACT|nr:FecR family protein [Paraflavisolibacter caeni]MCU7549790.1 FecR family protein [Paraflavisolibacter caeni]